MTARVPARLGLCAHAHVRVCTLACTSITSQLEPRHCSTACSGMHAHARVCQCEWVCLRPRAHISHLPARASALHDPRPRTGACQACTQGLASRTTGAHTPGSTSIGGCYKAFCHMLSSWHMLGLSEPCQAPELQTHLLHQTHTPRCTCEAHLVYHWVCEAHLGLHQGVPTAPPPGRPDRPARAASRCPGTPSSRRGAGR